MNAACFAATVLVVLANCARGDIVVQWNFNSPVPDGSSSTGTNAPSIGSGTASLIGGLTGSFAVGGSADPASSDNSAWNTSAYPSVTASNKTAGARFDAGTVGYQGITVSWVQRHSATASRYARFQYTVDGSTFSDGPAIRMERESVFATNTISLAAIAGTDNNPLFGFRVVTEFESTATGAGTNAYVATGAGSTYGPGGTIRFDMVTISGAVIPGSNTPPTITSIANQTLRVNQSTTPLPFTVLDAEDPAASLLLSRASSAPWVISETNIVFGGSGANRTVSVSAGGQPGVSTITIYVVDTGGKSNSTSFTVTVLPANTVPVLSGLGPTNTLMNRPTLPIPFAVGDLETPAGGLVVSGISANPHLVPNGSIAFGGSGSNRTVTVTPAANQAGVAPITIAVSDGTNTTSATFALMVRPSAGVLFYDPFSYADGSLLTNSGFLWERRSGTAGECQVTNGQLQVTAVQTEDVIGRLVGGPYYPGSNTMLYAAFKARFLTLPKRVPEYFAHFAEGSTLRGRVFAGTTNTVAPDTFRLFVANGSTTNAMLAVDLRTNTTYTIVTRYDVDAAATKLWLDPGSEASYGVTAADGSTPNRIGSYGFRQLTELGATLLVDDLKIGDSFEAVTATNAAIGQIPLEWQRVDELLVLNWSNPAFVLQAAPAVGGPYTNVPGAASPYTNGIAGPARFFRLQAN